MYYCSNCMVCTNETVCPVCGRKKLKDTKADDKVFLVTEDFFEAGILASTLDEKKIPFHKIPILGAGITGYIGPKLESYNFFVFYKDLTAANDIVINLFGQEQL